MGNGSSLGKGAQHEQTIDSNCRREGNGYVVLCPEVDVATQGSTVTEARDNLEKALTLFFETAPVEEVEKRLRSEVYVTHVEVAVG